MTIQVVCMCGMWLAPPTSEVENAGSPLAAVRRSAFLSSPRFHNGRHKMFGGAAGTP